MVELQGTYNRPIIELQGTYNKYLQSTLNVLKYISMTKTMHYVWGSPALYMVYGVFRIILYYYGGITNG